MSSGILFSASFLCPLAQLLARLYCVLYFSLAYDPDTLQSKNTDLANSLVVSCRPTPFFLSLQDRCHCVTSRFTLIFLAVKRPSFSTMQKRLYSIHLSQVQTKTHIPCRSISKNHSSMQWKLDTIH